MNTRSLTIRLDEPLEQELEQLRANTLPFGEVTGFLTDDDVFAAIS
jgi:hypothetical protein